MTHTHEYQTVLAELTDRQTLSGDALEVAAKTIVDLRTTIKAMCRDIRSGADVKTLNCDAELTRTPGGTPHDPA